MTYINSIFDLVWKNIQPEVTLHTTYEPGRTNEGKSKMLIIKLKTFHFYKLYELKSVNNYKCNIKNR